MSTGKGWKRVLRLLCAVLIALGWSAWFSCMAGATVVGTAEFSLSEASVTALLPGDAGPVVLYNQATDSVYVLDIPYVSVTDATVLDVWRDAAAAVGSAPKITVTVTPPPGAHYLFTVTSVVNPSSWSLYESLGTGDLISSATVGATSTVVTPLTTERASAKTFALANTGLVLAGLVVIFGLMMGVTVLMRLVRKVTG